MDKIPENHVYIIYIYIIIQREKNWNIWSLHSLTFYKPWIWEQIIAVLWATAQMTQYIM